MLNFTAMVEDGYVKDSVTCCYQEISRPEAVSLGGKYDSPDSNIRLVKMNEQPSGVLSVFNDMELFSDCLLHVCRYLWNGTWLRWNLSK